MMKQPISMLLSGLLGMVFSVTAQANVDLAKFSPVTISNAIFETWTDQPAGTGYIDSFLRSQANGNDTIQRGYNSDFRDVQFDEKTDPNFTRSLTLSAIPEVSIGSQVYREFLLDVNEPSANTKQMISLNELRFYVTTDNNSLLHDYDLTTNTLGGLTAVWDMDAPDGDPNNNQGVDISYDYFDGGSGVFDMRLLVPTEVFGTDETQYVYLYNVFGGTHKHTDPDAGFEEWAVHGDQGGPQTSPGLPEPGALLLFGIGLLGMIATRGRKTAG